MYKFVIITFVATCVIFVSGQSYEDKRCKCVCPSPAAVLNNTAGSDRKLYIANVPPNKCNCDGVILPRVGAEIKGREQEFCPRCECKYENRNTTIIKVVVIIVIWVIMLLVVYMGFLICLDPLINKRAKASYQEHTNEEDDSTLGGPSQPMGARGNVLNRVTHQQDKWKRQIYGRRCLKPSMGPPCRWRGTVDRRESAPCFGMELHIRSAFVTGQVFSATPDLGRQGI